MRTSEGAALGAALQALALADPRAGLEELAARCAPVDEASRVEPSGDFRYDAMLERQNELRARIF
jgi:hypothetical protein